MKKNIIIWILVWICCAQASYGMIKDRDQEKNLWTVGERRQAICILTPLGPLGLGMIIFFRVYYFNYPAYFNDPTQIK